MKVKTLITYLSQFNPEATVALNDYYGYEALFVLARSDDDSKVWIEGEADCDIQSEILARYEAVEAGELTELDFYSDLIEIGIDYDLIKREIGEKEAICMQKFCEEHGQI